jgi:hypothetical protein
MKGNRRARWVILAAAMMGIAIALVLLFAPDPPERAVAGSTTTSLPAGTSTSAPTTTITTVAPTTTSSVPAINVSPGRLVVETSTLDFGSSGVLRQLHLRNTGQQPVIWSAVETVEWLTAAPGSGGILGGLGTWVAVSLDRSRAPEGPFTTAISVTGPDGVVSVTVTGSADRGPVISGEATDAARIFARVGQCVPETTNVSATVIDGSGVERVVLSWRTVDEQVHTTAMASAGGAVWQTGLGPIHAPGNVVWWITATDSSGNETRTSDHTLPVVLCTALP